MIVSTAAIAHGEKVAKQPARHSVFEGLEVTYQAGQSGMPLSFQAGQSGMLLSFQKQSPQNIWRKADFLVQSKRK